MGRVREGEGSRARKEGAGGGAPGGEERSGEGALEGVLEAVPEAVPWLCTLTWGEGLAFIQVTHQLEHTPGLKPWHEAFSPSLRPQALA